VQTKEEYWQVERQRWRRLIGLDSLFQKTPMSTPQNRTIKPGDAFENTAFEQWFENARGCREAALHYL
jgi:hypothetical protein